ncbi:aminotransferase-like domain-containing protein [Paenibacillus eucommiae]|uniref:DNA-binding transcriptional MocR family regulator n=1 Tax=Paenibacillus eucommiae TaxID=1355755 RepID=A0ABS4IQL4_9BACL|nr:PLP-dependent aminotransferase family protein [Paenibacillus eucommiae]MBP1989865.1 DNA-binding transcriptional MocR family regulator [Paenibacillus eucommiae]
MYKYIEIAHELEQDIKKGLYKEGDRLPSIRLLSQRFACNKSSVIKALEELEKKHVIYVVMRSGYYVLKQSLRALPGQANEYDFATAAPDWNEFPYIDFQHCISKAIDAYQRDLFLYGTPKGLPSLIKVANKQLQNNQVFAKDEQIIITAGVQQALFILMSLTFPNGKQQIVIEQPGYHLIVEYINKYGIPAIGIERTAQGIDLNYLEHIFKYEAVKFFYTMPRFHNPLGTSLSKEDKLAIVRLAQKYDVYIVEDDFLADYEQDAKVDPLYAYDQHERVIYLKSYSKIMFPGLRIGVAVLPLALAKAFYQFKKYIDIDSSMISQAALEIYIKSKMFDHHKSKIQIPYIKRSMVLNESMKTHLGGNQSLGLAIPSPTLCMHTHVLLDKRTNLEQLIGHAKKRKIWLETAERHYLASFPRRKIVKLNVSNIEAEKIEAGMGQVAEAIKASFS